MNGHSLANSNLWFFSFVCFPSSHLFFWIWIFAVFLSRRECKLDSARVIKPSVYTAWKRKREIYAAGFFFFLKNMNWLVGRKKAGGVLVPSKATPLEKKHPVASFEWIYLVFRYVLEKGIKKKVKVRKGLQVDTISRMRVDWGCYKLLLHCSSMRWHPCWKGKGNALSTSWRI